MAEEEQKQWIENIRHGEEIWSEQTVCENWGKFLIYKIPTHMFTPEKQSKYKPLLVSFGPYHYGEEHLKPMEKAKNRALFYLLKNNTKDIQDLVDHVKPKMKDLMDAYEDLNEEWQNHEEEFLKMMIIDGSFIITILYKDIFDFDDKDPIFGKSRQPTIIHFIKRDMLLLENQLPFFIIKELLHIFQINGIEDVLQNFFFPESGLKVKLHKANNHLLDILRITMLNGIPDVQLMHMLPSGDSTAIIKNSHSATMLYKSGIEFDRSRSDSFADTIFENKVVHLPAIAIDQHTESLFLNFVAFEQLHFKIHRLMSSLLLLMGGLIIMPEDVKLLRDREIIQSTAMSDATVVEIMQNVISGLTFTENDGFHRIQLQLNDYYVASKKTWRGKIRTWLSEFTEKHLHSPWPTIELIAAAIGLIATVGGAAYTILPYYQSNLNSNWLNKFTGYLGQD